MELSFLKNAFLDRFRFDPMDHRMTFSAEGDQIVEFTRLSQPLVAQVVHLKVFPCPADGASEAVDPATLLSDAPPLTGLHVGVIVNKLSRFHHLLCSFRPQLHFYVPLHSCISLISPSPHAGIGFSLAKTL